MPPLLETDLHLTASSLEEAPALSVTFAALGRVLVTLPVIKPGSGRVTLDLGVVTVAAWEEASQETTCVEVVHASNTAWVKKYQIACTFEDFTTFYLQVLDGISIAQSQKKRINHLSNPQ